MKILKTCPKSHRFPAKAKTVSQNSTFLNILGGRIEAEKDIPCKSLHHFNKIDSDIIPTFQVLKTEVHGVNVPRGTA